MKVSTIIIFFEFDLVTIAVLYSIRIYLNNYKNPGAKPPKASEFFMSFYEFLLKKS